MKRMSNALVLVSALALAGCSTMAPKYEQPAAPVPGAWPAGEAYKEGAAKPGEKPLADIAWNEFFIDAKLRKVIGQALDNNRDLRVAALNIERARAEYQIQGAALFPTVNAGASGMEGRSVTPAGNMRSSQYSANLGFSAYELDFFGRVRSLKDKALEEFLGTEQARRSVQITLVSEVANSWLNLAADRERLRLAKETLATQEKSYELTKRRYDAGVSSELDLRQAQTTVEAARVEIARSVATVAKDRNGLELLAGSPVADDLLPGELGAITALKDIRPGIPSEVLVRRPDILQAENRLKGANANIGAARAAYFPRITLTTSLGVGSSELSGLFSGGGLWSFAPQISLPIFDGGARKANLKVAEVDKQIFTTQYEKTIQGAFREVADALAVRGTVGDQLAAQQALVDASAATLKLAEARYDKGVVSYLSVLDAQRSLFAAQQSLIGFRLAEIENLVTLYKVLGGGA